MTRLLIALAIALLIPGVLAAATYTYTGATYDLSANNFSSCPAGPCGSFTSGY